MMILVCDGPALPARWATLPDGPARGNVLSAFHEGDADAGSAEMSAEFLLDDGWPGWLCDVISQLYWGSLGSGSAARSFADVWLCDIGAAMSSPVDYDAARAHLMIEVLEGATEYGPRTAIDPVLALAQEQLAGRPPTAGEWGVARDAGVRAASSVGGTASAAAVIAEKVATAAVMAAAWPGRRDRITASALGKAARVAYLLGEDGHRAEREARMRQQEMLLRALRSATG